MAKKRVKKRRLNLLKVIIFFLILYLLFYLVVNFCDIKTKSIIIKNNKYLTDEEVISMASFEKYPSYFKVNTYSKEKKLEKNEIIKEAKIKRKLHFALEIDIKEEKILYKKKSNGSYVLGNNEEVTLSKNYTNIPTLINFTPKSILVKLNKKLNKIDDNVLSKISEIEYSPNKMDEERFLLYMNDGNLVYITISKTKELNYYVNIVKKLNNKKGILYLDSGNYFEVKE